MRLYSILEGHIMDLPPDYTVSELSTNVTTLKLGDIICARPENMSGVCFSPIAFKILEWHPVRKVYRLKHLDVISTYGFYLETEYGYIQKLSRIKALEVDSYVRDTSTCQILYCSNDCPSILCTGKVPCKDCPMRSKCKTAGRVFI